MLFFSGIVIQLSFSQETLQSVTNRGNFTDAGNPIVVKSEDENTFTFIGGMPSLGRGRIGSYNGILQTWMPFCINEGGGNVGVGTTSPVHKLEINGDFKSGINGSYFLYNGYADIYLHNEGRGSGGRAIVHDASNILTLNYEGDFTGGTKLASNAYFSNGSGNSYIYDGNVGIGTANPTQKLSVAGTVLGRKVKVSQPPSIDWPDYVFDSTYQLAPLSRVESFIQKNKHLPDIPSAAEVKKEGLDLGDNQAALLRKIEELTLYAIDQQKQFTEQKKVNDQQKLHITALETRLNAIEKMLGGQRQ